MKLNQLHLISEGLEKISAATQTEIPEIIDALTGLAWSEEESGQIKEFSIDALEEE